jgi:hypothetical protein
LSSALRGIDILDLDLALLDGLQDIVGGDALEVAIHLRDDEVLLLLREFLGLLRLHKLFDGELGLVRGGAGRLLLRRHDAPEVQAS